MKTRRRIRGAIKWGGAVLTVLLLIVWVGSNWYGIYYNQWHLKAIVYKGQIRLFAYSTETWLNDAMSKRYWFVIQPSSAPTKWWFDTGTGGGGGYTSKNVSIPIWFLVLLTGTPTFLIWRHDRKRPPGTCRKCGYSRTGLPTDRACPECGTSPKVA